MMWLRGKELYITERRIYAGAEAPFPVVSVQTFGPATPEFSKLIKKANDTLKLSVCWKDVQRYIFKDVERPM